MRKIILYMQISLDGVVSDVDEWMTLSDEIVEDSYNAYKDIDTIVVGSNTYPSMAEYWQHAERASDSDLERAVAKKINEMEKIVISRSTIHHLEWNNTRPLLMTDSEAFVREIEILKVGDGKNISVESGVKTWQLFIHNSLFDEIWLMVHPVVAANGDRLFEDVETKLALQLIKSKTYKNGVIGLHYQKNI
ncbi:dihydrofolate reductase family protein [Cohnella lupini]|uniref:Dihydrofolate reductase n=1 Tax=Cohnella lupini TaxID=1294267 RepID=A0A3D9ICE5_9BACL|nr:dihydrofolate reductase family protein [Cohnella lupini]RED59351.1 dihydrofolate reductase [Cohnella lupini]